MLIGAAFLGVLTYFGFSPMHVFIALPIALALISLALRMPAEKTTPTSTA